MQEIGSLIIFSHEDGDFGLAIEAMITKIVLANGMALNPIVRLAIKNIANDKFEKLTNEIKSQGISNNILSLLYATKKNELLKFLMKFSFL